MAWCLALAEEGPPSHTETRKHDHMAEFGQRSLQGHSLCMLLKLSEHWLSTTALLATPSLGSKMVSCWPCKVEALSLKAADARPVFRNVGPGTLRHVLNLLPPSFADEF